MDSYNIFITALLVVIILYLVLKKKRPSVSKQESKTETVQMMNTFRRDNAGFNMNTNPKDTAERKTNTVRRDNAEQRDLYFIRETLFTATVPGRARRFFLDVKKTMDGQQVLTISELEQQVNGEKAFRVIIFSNEIDKFKRELDRCYGYMKRGEH